MIQSCLARRSRLGSGGARALHLGDRRRLEPGRAGGQRQPIPESLADYARVRSRDAHHVERAEPSYKGEFVDFEPMWHFPKPARAGGPPVLLGAQSKWAHERVVDYCDGWIPISRDDDVTPLAQGLEEIRGQAEKVGRDMAELELDLSCFVMEPNEDHCRALLDLGFGRCSAGWGRRSRTGHQTPGRVRAAGGEAGLVVGGMEPAGGFEPSTCCLRNSCSTTELRRPSPTLPEGIWWAPTTGLVSAGLFDSSSDSNAAHETPQIACSISTTRCTRRGRRSVPLLRIDDANAGPSLPPPTPDERSVREDLCAGSCSPGSSSAFCRSDLPPAGPRCWAAAPFDHRHRRRARRSHSKWRQQCRLPGRRSSRLGSAQ